MEIMTEEEGLRTSVPSTWGSSHSDTQIRSFKNPGILCYRNAVFIMFLHTPLLLNWIEEVHPKNHDCGSFLCDFHHLIGFYWFGDVNKDTHEFCLDQIWKKLISTTWSEVNIKKQQDVLHFTESFLQQLSTELQDNLVRYGELQQFFRIESTKRLSCSNCAAESKLQPDQRLFLVASLPEVAGQPPLYDVAQAISHNLQPGSVRLACGKCNGPPEDTVSTERVTPSERDLQVEHTLSEKLDYLPEVLFVQVNHYDTRGKLKSNLKVGDVLIIPNSLRDPGSSDKEELSYELYSIIFHERFTKTTGHYTCAVKGPSGKWVLVKNDLVVDQLTLDKLFGMIEPDQQVYMLAYRRLSLNGVRGGSTNGSTTAPSNPPQSTAAPSETKRENGRDGSQSQESANGGTRGATLKQVISLREGVQWTLNGQLPFPAGIDRLIKLKGRARKHRAKVQLTLTSAATGEVLEGEVNISLAPKNEGETAKANTTTATKRTQPPGRIWKAGKTKRCHEAIISNSRVEQGKSLEDSSPRDHRGLNRDGDSEGT